MPLFGKTDALASLPKYVEIGRVHGVTVLTGGSGYTNGATQTVTFSGGGASVQATGTALVTGGVVQSITITSGGIGYTSDPTIAIPGASNATFAIKRQPLNDLNANILFVDDTEAAVDSNRAKGINSPGWWKIVESQDSNGDTRYRTELLVSITSVTAGTGDKEEDLVVADVSSVASISVQPTNQTTVTGGATFGVTASITGGGSITYQWQKAPAATPTKFANVVGQTSATIVLAGQTAGNTGDVYRVVVGGGGTKKLTSSGAILTFGT